MDAIVEGLLLGLSTGPLCLGTCAPALVPCALVEERSGVRANLGLLGQFLAGRLVAYLLFGAAVGYAGMAVGETLPRWAVGASLIGMALLLIAYALAQSWPQIALCQVVHRRRGQIPFLFGLLTGLNPCPPFLLAGAAVFGHGDPLSGVLLFAAFFLSTSLYLMPVAFAGLLSRFQAVRQVARWTAVLVGGFFLVMGLGYL